MSFITFDISNKRLERNAQEIWDNVKKWLYLPKTKLIYDFVTSEDYEHRFDALPRPDEISRQYPNACGWGTGMEDSVINGGALLSVFCDRYAVTGEESLRQDARDIMDGLYDCTMSHGVPGFVARSICPTDGKSVYGNSSRDQYTHLVHGFWKLYHSPLADDAMKVRIRECLVAVAEFTERSVTKENNYCLLMFDQKTPAPQVCQMWDLEVICPHEAARLPMHYAAAYDVTGDSHWLDECNKYLMSALDYSCQLWHWPYLAYALLQMACSLEVLRFVFPDGEANRLCRQALSDAAERVQCSAMNAAKEFLLDADLHGVFKDWRECKLIDHYGYDIPQQDWSQASREAGEAALVQMMAPDFNFTPFQQTLVKRAIAYREYPAVYDYNPIYLMAAYWRLRKLGLI